MRVLVTGSSGFVGRHLISRLIESGNSAISLTRKDEARADTFAGPSDIADIENWPYWPRDIDAVIHLAALNPERGSRVDQQMLDHANAEATGALTRRCVKEQVRRIVFVSTALVHSSSDRTAVSEYEKLAPQNPYAHSKLKAEEQFWAALQGSTTEGCVVRPVPVFGLGGRGMIGALLRLARLPVYLPLHNLGGLRSIVAVGNLTDALVQCASSPHAAGQTFLIADEKPMTVEMIVSTFRGALGKPDRLVSAPTRLFEILARVAGRSEVWHSLNSPFVVDTTNIKSRLGWSPPVATVDALAQLARNART